MKKLSFKIITTLWITLLVTVICALSVTFLIFTSRKTADDKLKQSLVSLAQNNADEMEYSNGIFEVENDFVFYSGGIYCDLFKENGEYISGETPHGLVETSSLGNQSVATAKLNDRNYYIYSKLLEFTKFEYEIDVMSGQIISYEADVSPLAELTPIPYSETNFLNGISTSDAIETALSHAGVTKESAKIIGVQIPLYQDRQVFKVEFISDKSNYGKVYIRAICPADESVTVFDAVSRNALYLFPVFIIITAIGAYFISRKTVSPIVKITDSARKISSGRDLLKRLDTDNAPREISDLSNTFNDMFERLQTSFENEKRFTSDASHELRTPLAVIKAECEYALSANADSSEKEEALQSVSEQADKMTALVTALLNVTRAEQGEKKFPLKNDSLSALVGDVCKDFAPSKNITLVTDIQQDIFINMNALLITQLLDNLLSNADKYGRENGTVKVNLYRDGEKVVLSVTDDGIGISEQDLPKIWNRFYRADASRSQTEGFGLGLALVKKIADIHFAECVADSEIGKFTKITIIF